jgi:hypothetical protein
VHPAEVRGTFPTTDSDLDRNHLSDMKVVLVTGGSGLVGSAIKKVVETEEKREDEKWIFLGSKDGDLWYVANLLH